MESLFPFLVLPIAVFALAILTNLFREYRHTEITLKPNCLLTRNPVVFITGPRSIFYFRKYWNAYPEILAEHGYQVFTIHLPWRGSARSQRLRDFLKIHEQLQKKYHFICDEFTAEELKNVFEQSPTTASVTILKESEHPTSIQNPSFFLDFTYKLHCWSFRSQSVPTSQDLGLQSPTSTNWLLQKMQEKGEEDFLG